jgi:DNA-binding NarL/FixJ family response regulator
MTHENQTVLIIDDDPLTRYSLSRLIRRSGRHTLGASTLAGGLALLDTGAECVVLDLDLPDGRGEVVLRAIRDRHLPCRVVICSGVDADRLDGVRKLHPDRIFTKPVPPDEFLSACRGLR